jgi:hypothetical protein
MTYITVNTDVDIDLYDIETDDLIDELERRGKETSKQLDFEHRELIEKIWMNRRTGKGYQAELDQLIYNVLGKVI